MGDMAVGDVVIDGHSYTFTDKGVYVRDNGVVNEPIPNDPNSPADPIDPALPVNPSEEVPSENTPIEYPKGTWVNNGSYVYQLADGSNYKGCLLYTSRCV